MTTQLEQAARQALEALDCIYSPLHVREINKVGAAITALRAALEQPAQQEPLTDEQIETISDQIERSDFFDCVVPFARAIEAAHGIKGDA